jgi:hypothetical protein
LVVVINENSPVGFVDAPEQWERDGVVTTERDDTREGLAGLADAWLLGCGVGGTGQEGIVAIFNLLEGVCVVVAGSLVLVLGF